MTDVTELDQRAPPIGFTEPHGGAVAVPRNRVEVMERPTVTVSEPDGAIRWSAGRDLILAAFVKAQVAFPEIKKNRTVVVQTKGGTRYDFEYATLDAIIKAIRKPLGDNKLGFLQAVEGSTITTMIVHESGQWFSSALPLKGNTMGQQDYGSAITYAKRYGLTALLGIAAEGEDEDGNVAEGNVVLERDGKPVGETKTKDEFQGGPHTLTKLREIGRKFDADLHSCEDMDQFIALMADKEVLEWARQVKAEHPSWWVGVPGSDIKGIEDRIESMRRELQNKGEDKAARG